MDGENNSTKITEMEAINEEFQNVYNLYKQCKFSSQEKDYIFEPLQKVFKKESKKYYYKLIIAFIILCIILYSYLNEENLLWHASAIGRLLLIEILPFWDWTYLHGSKCLITYTDEKPKINDTPNCGICESITAIHFENSISPLELRNRFLNVREPVVITDWPTKKENYIDVIDFLLDNKHFGDSKPCDLSTNLASGKIYADILLKRAASGYFESWYLHFRNCNMKAMKQLRLLTARPPFLDSSTAPISTNWLLMSNNYISDKFKRLNVIPGQLVMWSQFNGKVDIRLRPRYSCEDICQQLNFDLYEGETLVLISDNWDIEYRPTNKTNMAILSEMFWDEA